MPADPVLCPVRDLMSVTNEEVVTAHLAVDRLHDNVNINDGSSLHRHHFDHLRHLSILTIGALTL